MLKICLTKTKFYFRASQMAKNSSKIYKNIWTLHCDFRNKFSESKTIILIISLLAEYLQST